MDSLRRYVSATAVAGLLASGASGLACGGSSGSGGGGSTGTPVAMEDERGSVGVPPTAGEYCVKLGFTLGLADSQCHFPDGTSCEEWAFYRGECGQPHSYCNQHGGTISSKTVDNGSYTAVYGICDLNGKQCEEGTFIETGKCP